MPRAFLRDLSEFFKCRGEQYLKCMGILVEWENNFFSGILFSCTGANFRFFSSHVMWNYSHFFTTFKCYFLVELNIQQQQKYSQLWSQPQRFWFVTNTHHSVSITMINGALEIDNFSPFSSWLTHFSSLYKTKKEIYSTLTVD